MGALDCLPPCFNCNSDGVFNKRQDAGPCCDESCLESLAERQCTTECGRDRSEGSTDITATASPNELSPITPGSKTGKRKRKACDSHRSGVYERFALVLKRMGCICKVLTAQGLKPCCKSGMSARTRDSTAIVRTPSPLPSSSTNPGASTSCDQEDWDAQRSGEEKSAGDPAEFLACSSAQDEVHRCAEKKRGCSDVIEMNACMDTSCNANLNEPEQNCGGNIRTNTRDKSAENKANCRIAKNDCTERPFLLSSRANNSCGNAGTVAKKGSCCGAQSRQSFIECPSLCSSGENAVSIIQEKHDPYLSSPGCNDRNETSNQVRCAGPCPVKNISKETRQSKSLIADQCDIERGLLATEHVILDVQGLTCTGCETKLLKALQGLSGVYNLRTSLILSQAEFDLDLTAGPIPEVIKAVEKSTGFTCRRVTDEGQEIQVAVDDAKAFVEREYPVGVLRMVASTKHIAIIRFDAKVIGARTLLEQIFAIPPTLAAPPASSELKKGKRHVQSTAGITLLSSMLTIPVLVLAWAPLPPHPTVYGSASLALATLVQVVVAGPFYPSALKALIHTHVIEMDLLIVLSTSTAYIFSIISFAYQVAGRPLSTGQFFETSTLLVTLIMLGRLISAFARQRALETVSIRSLQAPTAILCDINGCGDREIDARLLQYGDFFKVVPDTRITTDGIIISGVTEVDESMITGESSPVEKQPGSAVVAGSLNGSGVIVVRLTHLPANNTISTVAAMVDEAKFSKPKTQELADIVAGYFVPVILALTLLTFVIWIAVGICIRHQDGGRAVANAITYAIAVLIVSCPCAIGLAIPMVFVIAGGVAAKHGVIYKSAMALETARNVNHVVLDKTGTLTQGRLDVKEAVYLSQSHDHSDSITLGLTSDSKHPVSIAMTAYLREKGVNPTEIQDCKAISGRGMEGTLHNTHVRCGNSRWLSAESLPEVQNLLAKGFTVFGTAKDNQVIAIFGLSDSIRPESHNVVKELQNRNITTWIVSGDDAGPVESVALSLNIPLNHVRSKCTPVDKQDFLKTLMSNEFNTVAFCGDGTNDAIALAQATIGIHMTSTSTSTSTSDLAQTAADIVLVRPHLAGLLTLLDLSKAARRRVLFNFLWSFLYNLFAITLAAGAFVNARIPPEYAGLGEVVSVVPVVLIALHLKFFKPMKN